MVLKIPLATKIDGKCKNCGEEELIYWVKDETENINEVYTNCENCGREFPKFIVKKKNDTSRSAIEKKIKKRFVR